MKRVIVFGVLIVIVLVFFLSQNKKSEETIDKEITTSKVDSLQSVIVDLEARFEMLEKERDDNLAKYEEIINEYHMAMEYIKYNVPVSYRQFHSMLSFSEHYSAQKERDNYKRLSIK